MERILEPEIMDEAVQVKAYAEADFEEPNSHFIELFRALMPDLNFSGAILDLGCGPGDITLRLAERYSGCRVHGIDGSKPMLDIGRHRTEITTYGQRVAFFESLIPDVMLPIDRYDAIVSNSLLHHLPDPLALWSTVKTYAADRATILVMDLIRPLSATDAQRLVDSYAENEPEILKRDFYNSLLAAFSIEEIETQLNEAGLTYLEIKQVSDRHVCVQGVVC